MGPSRSLGVYRGKKREEKEGEATFDQGPFQGGLVLFVVESSQKGFTVVVDCISLYVPPESFLYLTISNGTQFIEFTGGTSSVTAT